MRLSYSVQSICGLIQQKQQTMFKFNFYLNLTESFTKSELKRSCSLDSLLMAKVCLLLQSHQFCSSGFQEALLGQRRPTTLVRQRLVAPPSNSQLSPTSHLFSLSTTVLLGNLLSSQHQRHGSENFKNPLLMGFSSHQKF